MPTPTRIYLLAGQSNMVGGGLVDDLPDALKSVPDTIRLFADEAFQPFLHGRTFGPELGFAQAMAKALPDQPMVLCKVARGGANLYYDWKPDCTSGGPEDQYRGPIYPLLLANLQALQARLAAAGELAGIAGMLWMQGERDSVIEPMAKSYGDNLVAFIKRVRSDTGLADMPFVMGEIAPRVLDFEGSRITRKHAYRDLVIDAQRAVCETVPGVSMVRSNDLPQGDNLHFTAAGQILLGQRYAEAILER